MSTDWWARKLAQVRGEAPPAPSMPPISSPARPLPQHLTQPTQYNAPDPSHQYSVSEALYAGLPGPGNKLEPNRCPRCGSGHFFSRQFSEGGQRLQRPPAPQCFECGYAGDYYDLGEMGIRASGHQAG